VFSVKNLEQSLPHGQPKSLVAKAATISTDVVGRFPDLLSFGQERSERDQAAHYESVEPAYLSVIFFSEGRVGIELQDTGRGMLPPLETLDPERMTRDESVLTEAIDARLAVLHEFCCDLIDLAVQAEEWRLAHPKEER
jgi:hypothetical protein